MGSSSSSLGGTEHPHNKARLGGFLRVSSWCVCVLSFVACVASASPIFVPELKGEFLGGRSHSSATMIIHQSAMGPVTPPDPTLAVPLAVSTDHHINVPLSSLRLAVVCQEALLLGDSG
jgi:hypothetical protein